MIEAAKLKPTVAPPSMTGLADPEELVALLRIYHHETGMSLASMATAAGLHFNSFNRLFDPTWRPRLDTLKHIHSWLSGIGYPEKPLVTYPLSGKGWEISRDEDGWYIVTEDEEGVEAKGPFGTLRSAIMEAQKLFPPEAKKGLK